MLWIQVFFKYEKDPNKYIAYKEIIQKMTNRVNTAAQCIDSAKPLYIKAVSKQLHILLTNQKRHLYIYIQ